MSYGPAWDEIQHKYEMHSAQAMAERQYVKNQRAIENVRTLLRDNGYPQDLIDNADKVLSGEWSICKGKWD